MSLQYYRSDELPAWLATVLVNGVNPDFSSGYTFTVVVKNEAGETVLTKPNGEIVGAAGGVITVNWISGDLDLPPGKYSAHLIYTRTSGTLQKTIAETIEILARNN